MKRLNEEQTKALIIWGASKLGIFNGALEESDEMRHLSNKQMTIVAVCYAAGLAAHTKLDIEEFLNFAAVAYQGVEMSNGDKPPEQLRAPVHPEGSGMGSPSPDDRRSLAEGVDGSVEGNGQTGAEVDPGSGGERGNG